MKHGTTEAAATDHKLRTAMIGDLIRSRAGWELQPPTERVNVI
jgi:hypothetical protein